MTRRITLDLPDDVADAIVAAIEQSAPGGGTSPPPPAPVATTPVDPYNYPGILAVIGEVGTPDQRTRAYKALFAATGGTDANHEAASRIINQNAQADPQWNGAMAQLVAGKTPEQAYAIILTDPIAPSFTLDQLKEGYKAFFTMPL